MYIDKIYTKLYSQRDWNGLNQLVNEIKQFAKTNTYITDPDLRSELAELRKFRRNNGDGALGTKLNNSDTDFIAGKQRLRNKYGTSRYDELPDVGKSEWMNL